MAAAQSDPYNQPLTRWGHLWRYALCLVISGLAWADVAEGQLDRHPGYLVMDFAIGIAAYVTVYSRRRRPLPIALAVIAMGLVSATAAGPGVLALISLATRRRLPEIGAAAALSIVVGQVFNSYQPSSSSDPPWVTFTFSIIVTGALCVFGMYVGSRRELIWSLRERARAAEAEQELRVNQARSAERERIAREMHDVLAHRISLVTMHAGALAYRTDLPADQVRETATLVQEKAHEALADLRQVLGVLRGDDTGDRPQPALGDLDRLVAESREGGMIVDLSNAIEGDPGAQVGRTVYRMVQEGLTNARKHAPGAHVSISLRGDPGAGVSAVIRNPRAVGHPAAHAPGAGLGLVGLRERVAIAGGNLIVENGAESFVLRGWFPWNR